MIYLVEAGLRGLTDEPAIPERFEGTSYLDLCFGSISRYS